MVAMAQNSGVPDATLEYDYSLASRVYCGFGRGRYLFPIDDVEQDRLDMFHKLVTIARNEKLTDVEIPRGAHILEVGSGTGIWAIDMADRLYEKDPAAPGQILGLDIAYIQPKTIPATVEFKRADVEAPWPAAENALDLIHIQMMLGSIRDWPEMYRKSFRHLKPGGYVEQVEIEWVPRCDDGTLDPNSALVKWSETLRNAMRRYMQPIDVFDTRAELRAAGFIDLNQEAIRLPISPWSNVGNDNLLGRWFNLGLTHAFEPLTLLPFTRVEGMPKEQVDELIDRLKRDICALNVHAYFTMFVWTGKKPGGQ